MPVFYCIPSERKPFSVTGNGRPESFHDEFRQRDQRRQKRTAEGENGGAPITPSTAELEADRGPWTTYKRPRLQSEKDPFSESQINFPHIYQAKNNTEQRKKMLHKSQTTWCYCSKLKNSACYLIGTSEVIIGLQGPSEAGEVENTQSLKRAAALVQGGLLLRPGKGTTKAL